MPIHIYRGLARAAAMRGLAWSRIARESATSGADRARCLDSAHGAFRCARILSGEHVDIQLRRAA